MRKLSITLALAFLASTFAFVAAPASAQPMYHHRCPPGTHWIPGHRNRHGYWVKAHCGR